MGASAETSVHPSAEVHPTAELGAGVEIGPGAIIGPGCRIGDACVMGPRAILVRNTALGVGNRIHAYAVLGDDPQDRAYHDDDPGALVLGDRNTIREFVTIHRGSGDAGSTALGSDCFLMAYSHVGHNCCIGDRVILTNYAGLAGHVRMGDGCVLSGHSAVHQFCDVGEGCMFQAGARVSQHVPPFCIVHRDGNRLAGINTIGMRRAGHSNAEITDARRVYRALFRSGRPFSAAIDTIQRESWGPAARRIIEFCAAALAQEAPRARGLCRAGMEEGD